MKTACVLLTGILLSIMFPLPVFSQCAGGTPALTVAHDTTLYGVGNDSYSVSVPKFDPSLGTLLSADIVSDVRVKYGFIASNTVALLQSLKVRISREDDISSASLTDPIDAINQSSQITKAVAGFGSYAYGPSYMAQTTTTPVPVGDLINFEGAGTVNFDYETEMTVTLTGSLAFNLSFTAVQDTTHYSVIYKYCTASLLSVNPLTFSAVTARDKILFSWQQTSGEENSVYNIQVSTDGQNFSSIAALAENKTGNYSYAWQNTLPGNLYVRIQEKNTAGEMKYSGIREIKVDQHTNGGIRMYPTLYTGGNLQVDFPSKADWEIIFYAVDGRRVSESRQLNVNNAQINLSSATGNGVYTAEVINMQTKQKEYTRIVVQR